MSLWNPYGFTIGGAPALLGAAPPALRVMGGQATAEQIAAARMAFNRFCAVARTSPVPNPTETGRLPDGTPYRIVVVGPQTVMEIWPAASGSAPFLAWPSHTSPPWEYPHVTFPSDPLPPRPPEPGPKPVPPELPEYESVPRAAVLGSESEEFEWVSNPYSPPPPRQPYGRGAKTTRTVEVSAYVGGAQVFSQSVTGTEVRYPMNHIETYHVIYGGFPRLFRDLGGPTHLRTLTGAAVDVYTAPPDAPPQTPPSDGQVYLAVWIAPGGEGGAWAYLPYVDTGIVEAANAAINAIIDPIRGRNKAKTDAYVAAVAAYQTALEGWEARKKAYDDWAIYGNGPWWPVRGIRREARAAQIQAAKAYLHAGVQPDDAWPLEPPLLVGAVLQARKLHIVLFEYEAMDPFTGDWVWTPCPDLLMRDCIIIDGFGTYCDTPRYPDGVQIPEVVAGEVAVYESGRLLVRRARVWGALQQTLGQSGVWSAPTFTPPTALVGAGWDREYRAELWPVEFNSYLFAGVVVGEMDETSVRTQAATLEGQWVPNLRSTDPERIAEVKAESWPSDYPPAVQTIAQALVLIGKTPP